MKPHPCPCPMCGEGLDPPVSIEVCGVCAQELGSTGQVALHATAEFAPLSPTRAAELLRTRHARVRAHAGESEVVCTWCGKTRREVKKLLASGDARICNECVSLCADVLEAELGTDWR